LNIPQNYNISPPKKKSNKQTTRQKNPTTTDQTSPQQTNEKKTKTKTNMPKTGDDFVNKTMTKQINQSIPNHLRKHQPID